MVIFCAATNRAGFIRLQHKTIAPLLLTVPKVGRSPVAPQRVDGDTIDPRVSVPMVTMVINLPLLKQLILNDRLILFEIPWIFSFSPEPFVIVGQRSKREFCAVLLLHFSVVYKRRRLHQSLVHIWVEPQVVL